MNFDKQITTLQTGILELRSQRFEWEEQLKKAHLQMVEADVRVASIDEQIEGYQLAIKLLQSESKVAAEG